MPERSLRSWLCIPLQAQQNSKYHAEKGPKAYEEHHSLPATVFLPVVPNKAARIPPPVLLGHKGIPAAIVGRQRLERFFGPRVAKGDCVDLHHALPQGMQIALHVARKGSIGE
jgi:hypothetical protein